ncbi:hypothetical protein [Dapis sp. BLCC M172]
MEFFELALIFLSRLTPLTPLQSQKPFYTIFCGCFSAFIDMAIAQ